MGSALLTPLVCRAPGVEMKIAENGESLLPL